MKETVEKSISEMKAAQGKIESVCPKDGPCKEAFDKLKKDVDAMVPVV